MLCVWQVWLSPINEKRSPSSSSACSTFWNKIFAKICNSWHLWCHKGALIPFSSYWQNSQLCVGSVLGRHFVESSLLSPSKHAEGPTEPSTTVSLCFLETLWFLWALNDERLLVWPKNVLLMYTTNLTMLHCTENSHFHQIISNSSCHSINCIILLCNCKFMYKWQVTELNV